ncbi:fructose-specific PTS transporter subunit EIIC [Paraclostridium bifermentans]|uniref:fructose-specific PTS transporter subunit EIIC n=1 Tax=Paraclostridium bifermentans TaxID=1490 RepID=UPI0004278B20|nr:fructose-specific PTS transporter subunit EIIC [Paraclostridium bifermentans]KGJ49527.1 hypothetical protein KD33_05980 [Clostridium sp. NCR]MDV8112841.1 fructose-specific PTS transporter subunit EIIC [Bacillus sp. BAU-SS-2023]
MGYKIVGISNCPVGVAHTYMVAEALTSEGRDRGHIVKIETQGVLGNEFELTPDDIKEADYVILAIGRGLSDEDMDKFEGKKIIQKDINEVLKNVESVFDNLEKEAFVYRKEKIKKNINIFKHIMTGVSYTIPLAIAAGLLMSISSIITKGSAPEIGTYAYLLKMVGVIGIELMIPVLGAYIAYSISGKPALAPAFLGSCLVENEAVLGTAANGGFLGAIIVGLLVGYFVNFLKDIKLSKDMTPIMSFLIIPLISTLFISTIVFYIIGPFVSKVMFELMYFLNSLSLGSSMLLCVVIAIMLVLDMGGPINKTAYIFALSMAQQGNYIYFGTVAIVIIIPTVSIGIATIIRPDLFNKEELENGKSALTVGLFGITEPAIAYAVNDPKAILISQIVGASIAAIVGNLMGVKRLAPGANIIDPLLGNVTPFLGFYISVIIGVVVNTSLLIFIKNKKQKEMI